MSVAAEPAAFRSLLLDLLAPVPPEAEPLARQPVTGEPRLLIGGELGPAAGGRTFAVVDPSSGEAVGEAADASLEDMERAIAAARQALDRTGWANDHELRARCLRQLQAAMRAEAETLRRDLVAEIGCVVRMTYGDQLDRPIEKLGF